MRDQAPFWPRMPTSVSPHLLPVYTTTSSSSRCMSSTVCIICIHIYNILLCSLHLLCRAPGQRRTHSITTATERWPGGPDRQQQGKQANRGGTARSVTPASSGREREGGGALEIAQLLARVLPNPGPFVARRRWPSLSSSFPGREGDGVWDCGGVCHSDRGGGVGDHSSATAGRNGSAPVSVGEEAIGSAMNSSSVAQHRVNGRMQVGEKGKRCGDGGDKPGQPAVCIYVHWTGLGWPLT